MMQRGWVSAMMLSVAALTCAVAEASQPRTAEPADKSVRLGFCRFRNALNSTTRHRCVLGAAKRARLGQGPERRC